MLTSEVFLYESRFGDKPTFFKSSQVSETKESDGDQTFFQTSTYTQIQWFEKWNH